MKILRVLFYEVGTAKCGEDGRTATIIRSPWRVPLDHHGEYHWTTVESTTGIIPEFRLSIGVGGLTNGHIKTHGLSYKASRTVI